MGDVTELSKKGSLVSKFEVPDFEQLVVLHLSRGALLTRQSYAQDWECFERFVGTSWPGDAARVLLTKGNGVANALADAYRESLVQRGYSASTINRRMASLRSFVNLARKYGLVNWCLDSKGVRQERLRDCAGPGRDMVARMLAALDEDNSDKGLRDRAIVHLLYFLALRRGEVLALDVADCDLRSALVWVKGKGRTEKEAMRLPDVCRRSLTQWLAVRGRHPGALFQGWCPGGIVSERLSARGLYKMVHELGRRFEVDLRPHALRHASITEACRVAKHADIGLEQLLKFSRHSRLDTLMIYVDAEQGIQGKVSALLAQEVGR
jgi:integrase/recombinase XerC